MGEPLMCHKKINVDRETEIGILKKLYASLEKNDLVSNVILNWFGIPGIGKTTLGFMIKELCKTQSIPFFRFDFDKSNWKDTKENTEDPSFILAHLLLDEKGKLPSFFHKILKKYENSKAGVRKKNLEKVKEEFLKYINALVRSKGTLIFVFDTTEDANNDTIKWLEENLLRPLYKMKKAIIIWTGRYSQDWNFFDITNCTEHMKIESIPLEDTQRQVGSEEKGNWIYQITNGHPMGNNVIGEQMRNQKFDADKDIMRVLELLIGEVYKKYVFKNVDEDLQNACLVLSVLRQFDVVILERILGEFVNEFKETTNFLKVLARLRETSLVEYKADRKGYVLDNTVRNTLLLYMRMKPETGFNLIAEKASDTYLEWIERVPENRGVYIRERIYHFSNLLEIKEFPKETISSIIKEELNSYLKKHYSTGDPRKHLAAVISFSEDLKKDREIRNLMGESGFRSILGLVKNHGEALANKNKSI